MEVIVSAHVRVKWLEAFDAIHQSTWGAHTMWQISKQFDCFNFAGLFMEADIIDQGNFTLLAMYKNPVNKHLILKSKLTYNLT